MTDVEYSLSIVSVIHKNRTYLIFSKFCNIKHTNFFTLFNRYYCFV